MIFFVKAVAPVFKLSTSKFKTVFDIIMLTISLAMTFLLFGRLEGIGIGTVIMTAVNGLLIGLFNKLIDKLFVFEPLFKRFAAHFD